MSYAEIMMNRAKESQKLSDMEIVDENNNKKIPFPLTKPFVSFGTEIEEGGFPVGCEDGILTAETMTVNIAVGEKEGAENCRKYAEQLCMELTALDSDKRIISLSAGKCVFDESVLCYRISIRFGLREICRYGGE